MIEPESLSAALSDFKAAEPFPHVVIDDFIEPTQCRTLQTNVPNVDWTHWERSEHAYQKGKMACSDLWLLHESYDHLASQLASLSFLRRLSQALGGTRVYGDPYCLGAGLHATQRGGSLAPHRDAEFHSEIGMRRVISLVLFLCDAAPEDGGALVFYRGTVVHRKIQPKVGRCVIFECSSQGIHGVEEWHAPFLRLSFASFYYAEDQKRKALIHAPDWRANTADRNFARPIAHHASRLLFVISAAMARASMRLKSIAYQLASVSGSKFDADRQ